MNVDTERFTNTIRTTYIERIDAMERSVMAKIDQLALQLLDKINRHNSDTEKTLERAHHVDALLSEKLLMLEHMIRMLQEELATHKRWQKENNAERSHLL
jgi:hypothetical protein